MKTLQIENDFVGFLEDPLTGNEKFHSMEDAFRSLFRAINEYSHLLTEFPKAKWAVGYRNDQDKFVTLFSISTKRLIEMKKDFLI